MSFTTKVAIPAGINKGIFCAKQATMLSLLGNPRLNSDYNEHCQAVTNPKLKPLIATENVGPFKATGLKPALDSLKLIFAEIKVAKPDLYAVVGTAGMLCARLVRGSQHAISNHSWGTAIDLTIEGHLDIRGDSKVFQGLVELCPFFNKHGWFWGAGFVTEDAMHFELGDAKIRELAAQGMLGKNNLAAQNILSLGDRGPEVKALQEALNKTGFALKPDGEFGRGTLAAVMAFQGEHQLSVDGVVGASTKKVLGL